MPEWSVLSSGIFLQRISLLKSGENDKTRSIDAIICSILRTITSGNQILLSRQLTLLRITIVIQQNFPWFLVFHWPKSMNGLTVLFFDLYPVEIHNRPDCNSQIFYSESILSRSQRWDLFVSSSVVNDEYAEPGFYEFTF